MFRQNYVSQKPENVLNRVNELIASSTGPNADKEKQFALEQLHNVISSSKRKQWSKVYEDIMQKHMELCVDLKDNRLAKDGLHQYRNMVQNVDPSSLENVISHLLELAEARTCAAREKANKVSLAATAKVSDLDQAETPESIMLSTMTIEGVKDRTDRAVVLPWLKFLWDAYRAVLELLHKNAKLERAYYKTCEKAFTFCQDFQRNVEFRRLCDMLRQQLTSIQRFAASQPTRANRVGWEWTPEAIETHLQIRFNQLEVATSMEQWNEGFRTVEDIHQIMQLSKKPLKPKLMAAYYEKLTRIFWVSENHLFHAYAWFKYYTLCCEYRKDMKSEERALLASNVVLAALCTPDGKDSGSNESLGHSSVRSNLGLFDDDAILKEKNQQMALLLDFRANPSRTALLAELVAKGVLNDVIPELKNAYSFLESKFHPLTLTKQVLPIITFVKTQAQLEKYSKPLQKIAALHTVVQLSKVYSSIRISSVQKLFSVLDYSYVEIEDMLCDAINKRQLSMQIDHSSGSYRFGSSVNATATVENQLTNVGRALKQVVTVISPPALGDARSRRQAFLARVNEASKNQHAELQERKMIIERRKEGLERLVRERERVEAARKLDEEEFRRREERERLEKEEAERRNEKIKAQQDLMQIKKIKMEVEALGKEVDENSLKEMDEKSRQEVLTNAQQEVKKAKEDEVKRLAEQAKVLDYMTRAMRIEAGKNVAPSYERQLEIDRTAYDLKLEKTFAMQKETHTTLLAAKQRLGKLTKARGTFESILTEKQHANYEKKLRAAKEAAWETHRARKISKARFAKSEEEDRLFEEAERQREIEQQEEYNRLQAKQHEELRLQRERELEEANRRREEEEEEERRREEEEAARRVVVPPREDREEPPARSWGPPRDGNSGSSDWQRQGPSGRQGRDFSDRDRDGGRDRDFGFGRDRDRDRDREGGRDFGRDRDGGSRDFGRDRDGGGRDFGSRYSAPSSFDRGYNDRGRDRDGDGGGEWSTVPSRGSGGDRDGGDSGGRWGRASGGGGGGGRYDRDRDRDRDRRSGGGGGGGGGGDQGEWRRR